MPTLYCVLAVLAILLSQVGARSFWMDRQQDCASILPIDVQRDEVITIYAKTGDTLSSQGSCSLNFKALDTDAKIQIQFTTFSIQDCGVKLYITGDGSGDTKTYQCGDNPNTFFAIGRSVTLTLHKASPTANAFNFQLQLKAVREVSYPPQNDANPVAVGMIVGVVGGVFGLILVVACVGICCFRKYRISGSAAKSPYLYDNSKVPYEETSSHNSVGYTNDGVKSGSPMARKKLLHHSSSSSDRSDHNTRPNTLNLYQKNNGRFTRGETNNRTVPPAPPPYKSSEVKPTSGNVLDERGMKGNVPKVENSLDPTKSAIQKVDLDSKSKNPVLNALNSNAKFRKSMELNDKDAEERAKRISSGSSLEGLGQAPTPPSSQDDLNRPPKLPSVPKVQQSPRSKHAVIKRTPRPTSISSDELVQIEKGRTKSDGDPGNRIIRNYSSSSQSESTSVSASDTATKKRFDTTHSLKPDRSKGPKGRKKQTQSVSSTLEAETLPKQAQRDGLNGDTRPAPRTQKDRILNEEFEKTGSGRYSKRSNRSTPRSSAGKGGKGFSHRRGRSVDQLDSRPTTPTSAFGSMESLPPLARSSSKTSLYASRERLYDRRGRRRQGSYSESIVSSRDYRDYYSDEEDYDGYERPLSRRDRDRIYKSETDIGKNLKAVSTQTLRETATQTGPNETVDIKTKIVTKKKHRSKSMSSSGTQTKKSKNMKGLSSSESDTEVKKTERKKPSKGLKTVHSDTELKVKTKRSKSVDEIDKASGRPKPKPKPRKSTGADTHLTESVQKSVSMDNLVGPNPILSVPQSGGVAPQAMYTGQYNPQTGYPLIPPPGYSGHPAYSGQFQNMQNYPQTFTAMQPPPMQQPTINERKKSNWEMLCEITDSGYQHDDVTETGSVASSVFTNNPQSLPGYGLPQASQGYYLPAGNYQHQYGYQQQGPSMVPQQVSAVQPSVSREQILNKQSSWDALRQITTSQQQPQSSFQPSNNIPRNESIV